MGSTRLQTTFLLVLLTTIAIGQGGATSGGGGGSVEKRFNFGSQDYGFFITGTNTDGTAITSENQKLSGTKVEISLHIGSGWVPQGTPGAEIVTHAVLSDVEVYILGGGTPDDQPTPNPPGPMPAETACVATYRLATTYFAHNTDIRVRVKCKFTFTYDLGEEQNLEEVVNFDRYLQFTAYNLMQSAGTDVVLDEYGQPQYNSIMAGVSGDSVDEFLAYLGGLDLHHGLDPASKVLAMNQSASSIVDKSLDSTVMLGILHGSTTLIADSHAAATFNHNSISAKIAGKATPKLPGFNLVAYWACETFSLGTSGWAGAYGISSPRAYFGFPRSIYALCWTEEEWDEAQSGGANDPAEAGIAFSKDVSDHVEILLDHLNIGLTIGEARVIADSQIPMVEQVDYLGGYSYDKVPSLIAGDYLARLRYVYLSSEERTTLADQNRTLDIPLIKLPIQ